MLPLGYLPPLKLFFVVAALPPENFIPAAQDEAAGDWHDVKDSRIKTAIVDKSSQKEADRVNRSTIVSCLFHGTLRCLGLSIHSHRCCIHVS